MSDTDSGGNLLYDAAVGFMVSEKSQSNAWAQVALFVSSHRADANPVDPAAEQEWLRKIKREFRTVELQVKKDFGVSKLPVAWRSAKSTAISAVLKGITLVGSEGVMPKTDVSTLLKASKKGLPVSPIERFNHHLATAMVLFGGMTGADKDAATNALVVVASTSLGMVFPAPKRTVKSSAPVASS